MTEDKKYELIEKHLEGSMSSEEQKEFTSILKEDRNLLKEIELHRGIQDIVVDDELHGLRDTIRQADQIWKNKSEDKPAPKVISLSYWKQGLVAASVVMLGVFMWQLMSSRGAGSDELFAAHFKPYEMVLTQRSISDDNTKALDDAIALYAKQQYTESASAFRALTQTNPDMNILKLYECNAELASGQSKAAITCFTTLLSVDNLSQQARWYLGLAYLQNGQKVEAISIFKSIGTDDYKYESARQLINGLE